MESFLQAIADLWRPHPGQRDFLLRPEKTKVLACGRRWGKTEVCAVGIAEAILRGPPSQHFIVAPTLDEVSTPEGFGKRNILMLRNTTVGNFLDRCAISVPCHAAGELPVGFMLMGEAMTDKRVLAMARQQGRSRSSYRVKN